MSAFIIRMLQGERPIIFGTGEKRRDFVYVDDVNDFHLVVLDDERANGGTFNVGSATNLSVNEVYHLLKEQLNTDLKPIYKPDLPGEAETTLADISRAKNLGWTPKIDVREGLRRTIDYLKAHSVSAEPTAARKG